MFDFLLSQSITTLFIYAVALTALIISSLSDIKTREVPDFLSYGLIIFGILLNASFSIISWEFSFIISSLIGLGVMFLIGLGMFYTGQWGGGDSKMLMGLGALIGMPYTFDNMFLPGFLFNILIAGAIYGILWTMGLAIINRKDFMRHLRKLLKHDCHKRLRIAFLLLAIFVALLLFLPVPNQFYPLIIVFFIALPLLGYYLWIFVRVVEQSAMIVSVTPDKLTEGDWIAKEVRVTGKLICGPKDLGIERKQIDQLIKFHQKGLVNTIKVKQGIPFIPSFLLAFLLTVFLGSPFTLLTMIF